MTSTGGLPSMGSHRIGHDWSDLAAAAAAAVLCSSSGSSSILQARILEWVAFPFSRGSFQPRDPTQVSHVAGRFFTIWPQGKPKNAEVGSLSLL